MPKPSEYNHIRAWHALSGSQTSYWWALQGRAAEQNAPLDAIYQDEGGRWHRESELAPDNNMKQRMSEFLKN